MNAQRPRGGAERDDTSSPVHPPMLGNVLNFPHAYPLESARPRSARSESARSQSAKYRHHLADSPEGFTRCIPRPHPDERSRLFARPHTLLQIITGHKTPDRSDLCSHCQRVPPIDTGPFLSHDQVVDSPLGPFRLDQHSVLARTLEQERCSRTPMNNRLHQHPFNPFKGAKS